MLFLSTLIISKSVNEYTINLEINVYIVLIDSQENNMLRKIKLKGGKVNILLYSMI